jgi:hypothetical protein
MAATIAVGDAWILYAWHARGKGYSDTLTDKQIEVWRERLGRAERVVSELERVPIKPPQWYWTMIVLARAQGWSRERLDEVFDEAVASEPLYLHLYSAKAMYLLPRWHGEEGDWERFAETSAARLTGAEGSVVYGHIAWQVSQLYAGDRFFKQNRVSWVKIRQGFIDRETLYGTNNNTLNAFALMAGNAADQPTTRNLMVRIGDAWDPKVWKQRHYFERYRAWAFE